MNRMHLIFILFGMSCPCLFANSHSSTPEHPVRIIFDTDMGSDCDDVGALALLHTYADMNRAEIIGCIYSSGKVPFGAGIIEAINIYYGRPNIPIGANYKTDVGDPVDKMNAEKLANDTASFGHTIIKNRDTHEQTQLNRQLLSKQPDTSVVYLTVGHTKGLYDLMVSEPDEYSPLAGRELIQKKVKRWVALGALGANNKKQQYRKDWNFFFNGTAPYTKYLVDHFPVPVFFVDAGSDVLTGKSLEKTPAGNIVRTAYHEWLWSYQKKTLADQRPSWDLAAVYFAVEGAGDYLMNSGSGWLEFDIAKGCRWHSVRRRPSQYTIRQKEDVSQVFAEYLNQMIARRPRLR